MSLSLLGLLTEVMTMIGMEHLNFTVTAYLLQEALCVLIFPIFLYPFDFGSAAAWLLLRTYPA